MALGEVVGRVNRLNRNLRNGNPSPHTHVDVMPREPWSRVKVADPMEMAVAVLVLESVGARVHRAVDELVIRRLVRRVRQVHVPEEPGARWAIEEGVEESVLDRREIESPDPTPENWFWDEVQRPWKARQISSEAVRDLLSRHLAVTGGYYSKVAPRLGVRKSDYQRFIDFLKHCIGRQDIDLSSER